MPETKKPESKLSLHKVFMLSPDGTQNRTIELLAKDSKDARQQAERQANAIVDEQYTVEVDALVEEAKAKLKGGSPNRDEIAASVEREDPYVAETVEKIGK